MLSEGGAAPAGTRAQAPPTASQSTAGATGDLIDFGEDAAPAVAAGAGGGGGVQEGPGSERGFTSIGGERQVPLLKTYFA